jgi:hypothetical protein
MAQEASYTNDAGAELGESLDTECKAALATCASNDHDQPVRSLLNKQRPVFRGLLTPTRAGDALGRRVVSVTCAFGGRCGCNGGGGYLAGCVGCAYERWLRIRCVPGSVGSPTS